MTDLERVAQRALVAVGRAQRRAAVEAMVVLAREPLGVGEIARQQIEEGARLVGVEAEHRRQLPQDRAELLAEEQHALREEVGQRRVRLLELEHVREVAAAFEREDEVVGRRRRATCRSSWGATGCRRCR